jgi:hypothetical protein
MPIHPPVSQDMAGPACAQSTLSPALRFTITFAVLFALKWLLPRVGVPFAAQVLTLLVVATFFVWRFWWRCSPDRRGALVLGGMLWAAGLLKIALQYRA